MIDLATLYGTGVTAVTRDDPLVSLRRLCDRRGKLTGQRTQAVCRRQAPVSLGTWPRASHWA